MNRSPENSRIADIAGESQFTNKTPSARFGQNPATPENLKPISSLNLSLPFRKS
ncbi:hypothetical protein [Microcoleus sp. herbarium12]|uniref:hypothetical protein n=1 Tax=Microcoleus sp. herbarium12 TaxID=3055437 RepID=UPI002FCF06BD